MEGIQDQVADVEFTVETSASADEIYRATQRAALAAQVKKWDNPQKLKELGRKWVDDKQEAVYYAIFVGTLGGSEFARIAVGWYGNGKGERRVGLSVVGYKTLQSRILYFIPAGPKRIPALKSLQRFSEALRVELAAAQVSMPAIHRSVSPAPQPKIEAAPTEPKLARGWYPDPLGRHQSRWWDGRRWTETVGDNGVLQQDPEPMN